MEERIKKIIDELKPALQADGGDIEFIDYNKKNGVVRVELAGACSYCPMSAVTLKQVIEKKIRDEIPEIKQVIAV